MSSFGPISGINNITNQKAFRDSSSAQSIKMPDPIAGFGPTSSTAQVEFVNFLVDSGVFYRSNRFFVTVFPPQIPNNVLSTLYDRNGFRFVCESATIPNQTLFTLDFKLNNLPVLKLPYAIDYGNELNLTFRMSEGFRERKFFLNWMEYIYDINNGLEYYDNYTNTSLIVLSQIDTSNTKIYNTQFIGVYPTSIGSIDYSWDSDGSYVKQNVTFAYYRMLSEGVAYGSGDTKKSAQSLFVPPDISRFGTTSFPGSLT